MKSFDNPVILNSEDLEEINLYNFEEIPKSDYEFDRSLLSKESVSISENEDSLDIIKDIEISKLYDFKGVDKLLFIDSETSHMNGFAVSLAMIEYSLEKKEILRTYYKEFNPLVQIEEEAFKVHKISQEKIKNAETFQENAKNILEWVNSSDMIVAFNAIYDVSLLIREFERSGILIDKINYLDLMKRISKIVQAKNSLGRAKPPSLKESADFFGIKSNEDELHNALYDTKILLEVFKSSVDYISK
jgi:DNA polymerase III epsilon subunit-like protein